MIHTQVGQNYYKGDDGFGYRMYYFITNASCYDTVEKPFWGILKSGEAGYLRQGVSAKKDIAFVMAHALDISWA